MSVDLLFLGTGDAFGCGGRLQTAAHVRTGETTVLVDCGPSALAALRGHGCAAEDVDTIVLTHMHGDHFAGVPFFLMDAHYASKRVRPLTIIGPQGCEEHVAQTQKLLFGGSGRLPVTFPLTWIEWAEGVPVDLPGLSATAVAVVHSSELPCFGVRLSCGGRVLAFSGDTEWTDSLVALSADADVFVCECYGYEAAPPHHLDYVTLLRERPRLTCRRMLLTHMGDDMLRRASTLEIPTASDGLRVVV
jgi:ribonuclease BN (tRNA processing enzyme)